MPPAPPKNRWTDPSSIIGLLGMAGLIFTSYSTFKQGTGDQIGALSARVAVVESYTKAIDTHVTYSDGRLDRLEDKVDRNRK